MKYQVECKAQECLFNKDSLCDAERVAIGEKGKCETRSSIADEKTEVVSCIFCHHYVRVPKAFENECPRCGETFYTPSFEEEG